MIRGVSMRDVVIYIFDDVVITFHLSLHVLFLFSLYTHVFLFNVFNLIFLFHTKMSFV